MKRFNGHACFHFSFNRAQQELNYLNESVDPIAMDELHALRDYKMDLEDKLGGLQGSDKCLLIPI